MRINQTNTSLEVLKNVNSLTPKVLTEESDIDKISPYLDALKRGIESKNIKNIALTGAYGSGKSTILKTFRNLNKKFKYLNVSLATFKDGIDKDIELEDSQKDDFNRQIELSILQQIFYHVEQSEIPDSRFERINSISKNKVRNITIAFVLWLIASIILFKWDYITLLNPNTWTYSFKDISIIALLLFSVFFFGISYGVKNIIRFLNRAKINKLNFLKGEIELGKNVDRSIFNKHLDEILYFFQATDYNVIIIEDLDRFNNTEIFTKLREINVLINNSKLISQKVVFIYAIRDDIFHDESRTKFFDYIIPVIPFINPSNAREQLTKFINDAHLQDDFTDDFIDSVITFIDDIDMRLLTNIFHEYTIYKASLRGSNLVQDNLLAMMIYKNLYPDDFVLLSKNQGVLFTFFNNKGDYIQEFISKIDAEVEELKKEIDHIENESITDLKELRAIYINVIQHKIPDALKIRIDGKDYNFHELTDKDVFNKFMEIQNITYTYGPYSYTNNSGVSFRDIERTVNVKTTFNKRKSFIMDRNSNILDKLKNETRSLENSKEEIQYWDIKKVFETVDIENYLENFSNNNLMRNLLLNGYIDENYLHYISLFHEVDITQKDYDLERNIKLGIPNKYDYKLTRVSNIVKRIPLKYFKHKSILNYDLFSYLLNNRNEKFNAIIKLLKANRIELSKDESYTTFGFIKNYVFEYETISDEHKSFHKRNIQIFIKVLTKEWKGFWAKINEKCSDELKDNFLNLIIRYANADDIVANAEDSNLKDHLANSYDLLYKLSRKNDRKVFSIIQELEIKFEQIGNHQSELLDYVYNNNHYVINENNVKTIYDTYAGVIDDKNYNKSNFSVINNSNAENLIIYLADNIETYIEDVFLKIEGNDSETEETLIMLINDSGMESKLLIQLIDSQKTIVSNLIDIEEVYLKELLLDRKKITIDWVNIYNYYSSLEEPSINKNLISYLNSKIVHEKISKTKFKDELDITEDPIKLFAKEILKCDDFSLESYINIMDSIDITWKNIDFKSLDYDKVEWLIKNKKIEFNINHFNILRDNYGDILYLKLIEENEAEIIDLFDKLELNGKDLLYLLNSETISITTKISIIEKIEYSIMMDNNKLSEAICKMLTSNDTYVFLETNVIQSIFDFSKSVENRVKLLNLNFKDLDIVEIKTLLYSLPTPYLKIPEKRKRSLLEKTEYNIELAEKLLDIKFITSYKVQDSHVKIVSKY